MPSPFRHAIIGLLVFLLQWFMLGRMKLWGAYPDAVLLYVAWIALRYGRRSGALAGAAFGFLMDAVGGTWGIHMLVKTVVGFILGLFTTNERESVLILPSQAFTGSLAIALVHNGLLVTFLALQAGTRSIFMVTALWVGSAVYTATVGLLVALFGAR